MTRYLPLKRLIPVMIVYLIVSIIGMYHHELWYDEVQHWLIARDSKSLADLFSAKTCDDHVGLWKLLLYFISHYVSINPFAIQVFHLIIINAAVFIFLRYAPFDFVAKILVLFGYYFIFEYSILCRNYALGLLFLFAICALLSDPRRNLLTIGVLLFLMANTQEFFTVASVGIFLYLLLYEYEGKILGKRFYVFSLIFLSGIAVAASQLFFEAQYNAAFGSHRAGWLTVHNFSFAIHGIDKGFIPFPPLHDPNFWNRHLFEAWSSFVKVPISLIFIAFPLFVVGKSRKALLFYISCATCLLLFLTMSQMTGSRYYGMFFIYFIAAIWLADYDGVNLLLLNKTNKEAIHIAGISLFYLVLFTQALAGAYCYDQDYFRPFSQAKNTVSYLEDKFPARWPIVIDGYSSGPALSAYFRHPVYYLDIDSTCSSFTERAGAYPAKRLSLIQEMQNSTYVRTLRNFVLVSDRANCDSEINGVPGFSFNKRSSFRGAIIISENYNVYEVYKIQAHQTN